jgi:hypothetical protein
LRNVQEEPLLAADQTEAPAAAVEPVLAHIAAETLGESDRFIAQLNRVHAGACV